MRGKYGEILLTDKQEAWLSKHYKHTKNDEIAKKLGISARSVPRLAKRRGLKKSEQFMKKCRAEMAAKAKESHLKNGTYPPKGFKIPNSEVGQFKKGVTSIERLGSKKEAERIAKASAKRRETYKLEKARALFGLPRQTKLKVISRPKKQVWMRNYLRRRGYIVERGSNVAYYNSETRRSPILEARPMTGFTFNQI